MKKKGFTLIELLAVIVILVIIALIATPMILGVIETARKGAAESSVAGYLDAVEKQIMINQLDSSATQITDGVYDLPMNGISVKGEVPSDGWIVIENGQIANYSMKIMNYIATKGSEVTAEGEVATKPEGGTTNYVCKRATTLHTEECTQTTTYCCSGTGYTIDGTKGTTTITYGNLGEKGTLTSGDAFDCDVNGDGTYNSETERFYYVSGLDGDSNSDIAVLIYYNNTTKGVPDNTASGMMAYDTSGENWHGPRAAITNLPTTEQWNNAILSNTNRTITNEVGTLITGGGSNEMENPFSYKGYAARLITAQEVNSACGITVGSKVEGELDNCNYLMENTIYSSSTVNKTGYWLETLLENSSSHVWTINGYYRYVGGISVSNEDIRGVRPVIEVLKSNIEI